MVSTTDKVEAISIHVTKFLESRKNANSLLDIFQELENNEDSVIIIAGIKALRKIFLQLLSRKVMSEGTVEESGANGEHLTWLKERYRSSQNHLLSYLGHSDKKIQCISLNILMELIAAEGKSPIKIVKNSCFPFVLFNRVITHLVDVNIDNGSLIKRFQEIIEYDDIQFHVLKSLLSILKIKSADDSPSFVSNVYSYLQLIDLKSYKETNGTNNYCTNSDDTLNHSVDYSQCCKLFSSVWMKFLKLKLTNSIYKKVLLSIHSKVLPHFQNALQLTDFFIESYDIGGPVSLLALNGLYFLIQKYNLEYPDFYVKLYQLLDSTIFYTKYYARFFHLLDIFLSSTYLPAYLAAAFAKRLSRLALSAPVNRLFVVIPFVGNILIRHPNLMCLIHNTENVSELDQDPYVMEEHDPEKCNAMNSSLWEIKDLQSHWHPDIATKALLIDKPLPKMEFDISENLEMDFIDIMKMEQSKKFKSCPTNYIKPISIYDSKFELWKLSE